MITWVKTVLPCIQILEPDSWTKDITNKEGKKLHFYHETSIFAYNYLKTLTTSWLHEFEIVLNRRLILFFMQKTWISIMRLFGGCALVLLFLQHSSCGYLFFFLAEINSDHLLIFVRGQILWWVSYLKKRNLFFSQNLHSSLSPLRSWNGVWLLDALSYSRSDRKIR